MSKLHSEDTQLFNFLLYDNSSSPFIIINPYSNTHIIQGKSSFLDIHNNLKHRHAPLYNIQNKEKERKKNSHVPEKKKSLKKLSCFSPVFVIEPYKWLPLLQSDWLRVLLDRQDILIFIYTVLAFKTAHHGNAVNH